MGYTNRDIEEYWRLDLDELPPTDAIILIHKYYTDSLNEFSCHLMDGRRVITTLDGAKNLLRRPGVRGIRPWEIINHLLVNNELKATGTPCKHVPQVVNVRALS